ncbi:MAG: ATPase involved in chromosome partitioning [Clostridia bacterium]|jgi:Mrp family chromosome partitioning ATPase|nr:ATPase involved in chromosome partitioning [Clostridia bacterium]
MSECSTCTASSCDGCDKKPASLLAETHPRNKIKNVIAVVSGKGGVGKSLVTSLLAVTLHRMGNKVGIMDADITGPSIPKIFGLKGPAYQAEDGVLPVETKKGIRVISLNLLMEDEDAPVIWRGPVISGVVKQFWTDVIWGELDYLLIDMPPGTGDVPLTVFQSIPLDGIVVVTLPQDLVSLIVKKSYHMAVRMDIPILGMVQNMSYVTCPRCGEIINLFGGGRIEDTVAELGIKEWAKLPVDPEFTKLCDQGRIEDFEAAYLNDFADKIKAMLGSK